MPFAAIEYDNPVYSGPLQTYRLRGNTQSRLPDESPVDSAKLRRTNTNILNPWRTPTTRSDQLKLFFFLTETKNRPMIFSEDTFRSQFTYQINDEVSATHSQSESVAPSIGDEYKNCRVSKLEISKSNLQNQYECAFSCYLSS